jgi:transcriptional regulator with GAF, ATPase, and Fis domain
LERACIVATGGQLRFDFSPDQPRRKDTVSEAASTGRIMTEREFRVMEADNIRAALTAANGKIYGVEGAAARLGMKPTTLASRIKALGINH